MRFLALTNIRTTTAHSRALIHTARNNPDTAVRARAAGEYTHKQVTGKDCAPHQHSRWSFISMTNHQEACVPQISPNIAEIETTPGLPDLTQDAPLPSLTDDNVTGINALPSCPQRSGTVSVCAVSCLQRDEPALGTHRICALQVIKSLELRQCWAHGQH